MLRFSIRLVWILSITMSTFGLLVISYAGKAQGLGPYHFLVMQSAFLAAALIAALILSRIDYGFFRKPWVLWTLVAIMLIALIAVLTPGIGKSVKGSHRWIGLGPINLQPIEFVKLMVVIFLSAYLDRQGGLVNRLFRGLFVPVILLSIIVGLLILQPDFGGTIVVCLLAGVTMLLGGVSIWRCGAIGIVAIVLVGALILSNPNRRHRLQKESDGENYQAEQSEIAFRNGGIYGLGLGQGMQKERYLPECHTDFIFAVIGEDFGIIATGGIVVGFLLLLGAGTVIAIRAPDKQGMLLAFGATMMLCFQAAVNMAVVTHIFPTKGLALPFFSYGGSCLLSTFCAVGVLCGVGRVALAKENQEDPISYKVHSFE